MGGGIHGGVGHLAFGGEVGVEAGGAELAGGATATAITGEAFIAGEGACADVVEATELIRKGPFLGFGEVLEGGLDVKGAAHSEVEGFVHRFNEDFATVGVATVVGIANANH